MNRSIKEKGPHLGGGGPGVGEKDTCQFPSTPSLPQKGHIVKELAEEAYDSLHVCPPVEGAHGPFAYSLAGEAIRSLACLVRGVSPCTADELDDVASRHQVREWTGVRDG